MRVKTLKAIRTSQHGDVPAGQDIEVGDNLGRLLVRQGSAEFVRESKVTKDDLVEENKTFTSKSVKRGRKPAAAESDEDTKPADSD